MRTLLQMLVFVQTGDDIVVVVTVGRSSYSLVKRDTGSNHCLYQLAFEIPRLVEDSILVVRKV